MNFSSFSLAVGLVFASSVSSASFKQSSVSGTTVSGDLKNFNVDVNSFSYKYVVNFGCLYINGILFNYVYVPSGTTFNPATVNLSDSLIPASDGTSFEENFKTYYLDLSDSAGCFNKYQVKSYDGFHSLSRNRWFVSGYRYFPSGSYVLSDLLDCVSETLFDDSSKTLISAHDKLLKITDCCVSYTLSPFNNSNQWASDSGYGMTPLIQNYYYAFNTNLELKDIRKIKFSYNKQYFGGRTNVDVISHSYMTFDTPAIFENFKGSVSFDTTHKDYYCSSVSHVEKEILPSKITGTVIEGSSNPFVWLWNNQIHKTLSYSFDSISKVSDHSEQWSENVKKYTWAVFFERNLMQSSYGWSVTDYPIPPLWGGDGKLHLGNDKTKAWYYEETSSVTIIDMYATDSTGLCYFKVIAKPSESSGADTHSTITDPVIPNNTWWDKFCDWFMKNLPMSAVYCVLGVAFLPVLISLIAFVPGFLGGFLKVLLAIFKALWWIVSLPFRLIAKLFSSHKRK